MRLIAASLLLLGGIGLHAQSLVLGETREAMHQAMGMPSALFSIPFQKSFPVSQEEFVRGAGAFNDVWSLKTSANEFEVSVGYGLDSTSSRLHPTTRVRSVRYLPDHSQAGSALLNQIPSARVLCVDGCGVTAERDNGAYAVLHVCRRSGNAGDATLAAGSYHGWDEVTSIYHFAICANVSYVRNGSFTGRKMKDVDWSSLAVDYITLSGEDMDMWSRGGEIQFLGEWRPS